MFNSSLNNSILLNGIFADYSSAVTTTATTFTAPYDCEYWIWIKVDTNTSMTCTYQSPNGTTQTILASGGWNGSYFGGRVPICRLMEKGATITFTGSSFTISGVYAPLKGAM